MKKIAIFILVVLVCCLGFSACAYDPSSFYFSECIENKEIVSIELIYYNNPDSKEIRTNPATYPKEGELPSIKIEDLEKNVLSILRKTLTKLSNY